MHDELNEIPGATPDFRTELAEKLADLVPEAVADGKIDTKKLEELLDGDAADTRERFGLFWPGKKRALRAAQEPTTASLVPDKENSKDWDTTQNVFIEGDNLEVLKILQKHYHGKIKMIYIDPPYNTGQDFVYPDNYQEGLKSYLEFTKQVDEGGKKLSTNSDQAGRYHSNWLNMMYPRLKLARNLMADDGIIFVSIDDHEIENLTQAMNQVFGEANHLDTFVWVSNLKGRQISGAGAAGTKEYILAYARRAGHVGEFRASAQALKAAMPSIYKGFDYQLKHDDHGAYVTKNELYNTNSAFNEATRPNLVFDIYYRPEDGEIRTEDVSEAHIHEGFVKIRPKRNNNGRNLYHAYRWSRKKIHEEPHNLEFVEHGDTYKIYTKVRDADSTTVKDLVMDIGTTAGSKDIERLGLNPSYFDYPKPVALIKLLTRISTDSDSLVLDFFAGSGTTAHAVMDLNAEDLGNRRFIQVQLPEPLDENSEAARSGHRSIADISRWRISTAARELEAPGLGNFGFRSYKLSDTNFAKWRLTSDVAETELEQHLLSLRESADDQASQEALLTELLLKRGYSLTEQVDVFDVAGLEIHGVKDAEGDYGLLAYLNEHQKPSLEQLRALVDAAEAQVVILEDAFQGDDQLKTNLAQLCKSKGIELWTA